MSTVANGTAPMVINSQTRISNLNADFVDGYQSSLTATANTITIRDSNANITANYFIGNGSQLTGISVGSGSQIINGNTNVTTYANANVAITVAGVSNTVVFTTAGITITGNISGGNTVSANYLTGILTTASQPNITSVGTLTSLGVNGTLTAVNITANTGLITGTLATANQPNITGVGTLTSLNVTGNANVGNLNTGGQIVSTAANGIAPFVISSQTRVANLNADYVDNYQTSLTSVASTIAIRDTNASITANIFIGNIAGANVSGQVGNALVAGTVYTAAQPNITSVGTLTGLTSSGNITSANLIANSFVIHSVTTGISAFGTAQGNATILTKQINIVSTVNSGQGVALPTGVSGMIIYITNTSANSVIVYPASGASAQINSLGTNAGFTQASGATLQYIAPTSTQWYTVGATYA